MIYCFMLPAPTQNPASFSQRSESDKEKSDHAAVGWVELFAKPIVFANQN